MSLMHYEISAAALHTARMIQRNFELREIGTVEATENNLAIIVDVATQVFRMPRVLACLVRDAPWWDEETLERNLERLAESVRAVEMLRARMPAFRDRALTRPEGEVLEFCKQYTASAPAVHAAKTMMQQFCFVMKTTIQPTERNLAILVDVGTQIFRVERAVDALVHQFAWGNKAELKQHLQQVRRALRVVEIMKNRIPSYMSTVRVTLHEKQDVEVKLTKARLQQAAAMATRVAQARTVEEQQSVLQRAGLVAQNPS